MPSVGVSCRNSVKKLDLANSYAHDDSLINRGPTPQNSSPTSLQSAPSRTWSLND